MINYNNEPQVVVMPFGKYKGEYLGDIPVSYLAWLISVVEDKSLKSAVQKTHDMLVRSGEK